MLRFDKLTVKGQEALQAAQEMGARSGQQQIEQLQRQLDDLKAKTADADGVTVNGVPLSEAQRNQPG